MISKFSRQTLTVLLFTGTFFLIIALPSCKQVGQSDRFNASLSKIDAAIAAGDARKALKALSDSQKYAVSASQWISVVKRERSLGANDQAIETLQSGLKRIPSSIELKALLADTFIEQGRYADACSCSPELASSPYSLTAAYAELMNGNSSPSTGMQSVEPEYWLKAAEGSGNPLFIRNAAVSSALKGDLAAASATASRLEGQNIFVATLCYDAGFTDRVFALLAPSGDLEEAPVEGLSLIADAAWTDGNHALAREAWQRIVALGSKADPEPLYDLTVTEPDGLLARRNLEALLSHFPAYWPAVVRYVRSVPEDGGENLFDPLEAELASSGVRTLDMERKIAERPVTRDDALRVLDAAIGRSGKDADIRFIIEKTRMENSLSMDGVKSASSMWRLLEEYPDSQELKSWAIWYFMSQGDLDSSFSLNGKSEKSDPFYSGLESALSGDLDHAAELFSAVAGSETSGWCALANIGVIHEKLGDSAAAVENYSIAAGLANDEKQASRLQYEAARVLYSEHATDRAKNLCGYALELDPSNYRANQLLKEIIAIQ